MPKCKDCEFCIGYDSISDCFICNATNEIEYIEPEWAEDNELRCDLYVKHNIPNNSTKN